MQPQIDKIRERFGIQRVVMVGDRGLITSQRIEESMRGVEGLDWITALRADSIQKLASQGLIQTSLFDQRDLVEVISPDYPGERLVVCRNPLLAEQRKRKREELLQATEKKLEEIVAATQRKKRALRGKAKIALRVGKVVNHYKVGKHFALKITSACTPLARQASTAGCTSAAGVRTSAQSMVPGIADTVEYARSPCTSARPGFTG